MLVLAEASKLDPNNEWVRVYAAWGVYIVLCKRSLGRRLPALKENHNQTQSSTTRPD